MPIVDLEVVSLVKRLGELGASLTLKDGKPSVTWPVNPREKAAAMELLPKMQELRGRLAEFLTTGEATGVTVACPEGRHCSVCCATVYVRGPECYRLCGQLECPEFYNGCGYGPDWLQAERDARIKNEERRKWAIKKSQEERNR